MNLSDSEWVTYNATMYPSVLPTESPTIFPSQSSTITQTSVIGVQTNHFISQLGLEREKVPLASGLIILLIVCLVCLGIFISQIIYDLETVKQKRNTFKKSPSISHNKYNLSSNEFDPDMSDSQDTFQLKQKKIHSLIHENDKDYGDFYDDDSSSKRITTGVPRAQSEVGKLHQRYEQLEPTKRQLK
jgi:hypothetical protein